MTTIIGIDPGKRTGIAIYLDGELLSLFTVNPMEIENVLIGWGWPTVVFEDSRMQSPVFPRGTSPRVMLKIARNVGEIDHLCAEIEALCKRLEFDAVGVSPQRKGRKLNADQFKEITGWARRSNQHERDAAMVAYPYRRMKD